MKVRVRGFALHMVTSGASRRSGTSTRRQLMTDRADQPPRTIPVSKLSFAVRLCQPKESQKKGQEVSDQRQSSSDSWWKYSLAWAVGTAIATAILLPFAYRDWRVVLVVGGVAFALLTWLNPKLRFWRLAQQLLAVWAVSRFGSKCFLLLGLPDSTLAFAFENDVGVGYDIVMGLCFVVALVLDCFARNPSPFGSHLRQFVAFQPTRQITDTNLGTQFNVGNVQGDVHLHATPPTEEDVNDALENEFIPPAVREQAFNDQIDIALSYMKDNKVDVAIEFLMRLRKRNWDEMTPRERYRTLANLGHCRCRKEEYTKALAEFREALTYQPGDVDGQSFVAQTLHCCGKDDEAREMALAVVATNPDQGIAQSVVVATEPGDVPAESLWSSLPITVQENASVLSTLGWRAAKQRDFNCARRIAEKGLDDDLNRLHFQVLRAAADIGEVSARVIGNPPPTDEETELIEAAIHTLEDVEANLPPFTVKQQIGQLYYYLASAYRLIGKNVDAETAYRNTIKYWPKETEIGRQYSHFLHQRDRLSDAIRVLDESEHHAADIESITLLAHLLYDRDENGDRARAKSLIDSDIQRLSECDLGTVSVALSLLAQFHGHEDSTDGAVDSISSLKHTELSSAHRKAFIAEAYRHAGDNENAKSDAKEAVALLTDAEDQICLWDVGMACKSLGLFSDALSVFHRFVTPASHRLQIMAVLECADRSNDTKSLLQFCTKLRESDVLLKEAIELEAVTRESFDDVDGALEVLDYCLSKHVEDEFAKFVRLRKAILGIKYDKPELCNVDTRDLPSWNETDTHIGRLVVLVLRHRGEQQQAIEYAYSLLRSNFGDSEAHHAFVASVGPPGSEVPPPRFDVASTGCAVQFKVLTSEETGWWILEDIPDAKRELRELSLDHPTAKDLIGKKVGDEFTLRSSDLQEIKAKIVSIISKYQYRYGEILDNWQDRFPDETFVWKVEMQKDDAGQLDISPILRSLDKRAEATEQLHTIYREHPLSISNFSVLSGVDAIEAAAHLAGTPDLDIRCCLGNEDEYQLALAASGTATRVVLCPTAIATLWLTAAWQKWSDLPFTLVVPRAAMQKLRQRRENLDFQGSGFMGKVEGQYVLTEDTEKDRQRRKDNFNEFYTWVEQSTEEVSGISLAEFSADQRQTLTDLFGAESAQAIAIASNSGLLLWSDDLGVAELGRTEFNISRTWTEIILGTLVANKMLEDESFAELVALLNGYGYRHTRLTPEVIVASAVRSEWKPDNWPFPSVVKWCQNPAVNLLGVVQIVSFSLPRIWQTAALPEQAASVTRVLLDTIKGLQGGDDVLRAIIGHLDRLFGVDVINCDKCRDVANEVASDFPERRLFLPGDGSRPLGEE